MLMSLCLGHSVELQPFLSFQLSSGIREVFPNWNESSSEPLKVTALEQITCEEKLKQLCFSWFQDTGRLQSSLTTCREGRARFVPELWTEGATAASCNSEVLMGYKAKIIHSDSAHPAAMLH